MAFTLLHPIDAGAFADDGDDDGVVLTALPAGPHITDICTFSVGC